MSNLKIQRLTEHMRYIHPEMGKFINLYKCYKCDLVDIMEHHLMEHYSKKHEQMPVTEIFGFSGMAKYEQCDACGKYVVEGWMNLHKMKCRAQTQNQTDETYTEKSQSALECSITESQTTINDRIPNQNESTAEQQVEPSVEQRYGPILNKCAQM